MWFLNLNRKSEFIQQHWIQAVKNLLFTNDLDECLSSTQTMQKVSYYKHEEGIQKPALYIKRKLVSVKHVWWTEKFFLITEHGQKQCMLSHYCCQYLSNLAWRNDLRWGVNWGSFFAHSLIYLRMLMRVAIVIGTGLKSPIHFKYSNQ